MVQLGNRLFPFRRFFYGIPILILLVGSTRLRYPFGSHLWDEIFEMAGFVTALTGIALRFWASGSSLRGVIKKAKTARFHLRSTGIFSAVRHPHFLGDFLIAWGLSIPLVHPVLILLSLTTFGLLSFPILFAREILLLRRYPNAYQQYRAKTPLLLPSLKNWTPNKIRFRWCLALRKEANLLGVIGILFFCIEQFRDRIIEGRWDQNPLWVSLVIPFFIGFVLLSIFDTPGEDFPNVSHGSHFD